MSVSPRFFRVSAAVSLLAALGVLVAQFALTGYPSPASREQVAQLYVHPTFRAQQWVILVQVFFMFLALWACTLKARRVAPGLLLTGFLFFVFWQVLELLPRSVELFAISYSWAPQLVASQNPAEQAELLTAMERTGELLGAAGYARRAVWALGHLTFGLAFWRGAGVMKAMSAFFLLNALRLLLRMAGEATGLSWMSSLSGGLVGFVAAMVPLFLLMAWWLWREPVELGEAGRPMGNARA